jgi:predicted transcriptional regulator
MKRRRLDVIQCVRLDPELADRLRAVAELEGVSLSVLMRRALVDFAWRPAVVFSRSGDTTGGDE